jgi:hypothetical protein
MIPDTTNYMIAGFAVILAGLIGYGVSLVIRLRSIAKQEKALEDLDQTE